MSQLRLDPLTGRWVVITAERAIRPNAFLQRSHEALVDNPERCPFCMGNEEDTPPPIHVEGPADDWKVRVIPNLYPAFTGHEPMAVENLGPVYMQAPASGSHEVVVFSPDHKDTWADLPADNIELLMRILRDRTAQHAQESGLRYTQIIINFGREAGASVAHPHGQLLGMPFVPRELMEEQGGFTRFRGNCIMCATVESEDWNGNRVVYGDDDVMVFCPYASGVPFEMMIVPRKHHGHFNTAEDSDIESVGRGLQKALLALRDAAGDVAYNVILHAAPFRSPTEFHWHVHLLPKMTTPAGFELGTGVPINVIAPETAAKALRDAVESGLRAK